MSCSCVDGKLPLNDLIKCESQFNDVGSLSIAINIVDIVCAWIRMVFVKMCTVDNYVDN